MATGVLASPPERVSHTCTRICAQEHYDLAAWDYIDLLREMSAAQARKHLEAVDRLERQMAYSDEFWGAYRELYG